MRIGLRQQSWRTGKHSVLGTRYRPGFTILEVLLSCAIGVLLMSALYSAMTLQLKHAQAGREVVERSLLVRSLFARVSNDIMMTLGPVTPVAPSSQGGSGGGGGAGGASAANTSGASSNSGSAGSTGGSTTAATGTTSSPTGAVVINFGVQGTNNRLIVNVSRLPRDVGDPAEGLPPACDMRRITYWLCSTGEGLCRQEFKPITSDDATGSLPPDIPNEASYVLADEVKALQFQYFDGSTWQDTWDGTLAGADGVTPLGPPQAVAISIDVQTPGQAVKTYRHVVAFPTANGTTQAATTSPTSSTGN